MNAPQVTSVPSPRRKQALTAVSAVVLLGAVWGAAVWYSGRHEESTDNAYVQGHLVQITPQIAGTVTAIAADDTDFVRAGQSLVTLDRADTQLALDKAEANLAQTVRQVRSLYANNATLAAQVKLRETDIARAQTELARARDDLARRQSLSGHGAVSQEELAHTATQVSSAQDALATAQAAVAAAREQLAANQALTAGARVAEHPSVQAAAAQLRETYLAAQRSSLPAPVSGYVARRTVQLGQRVAAGTPLMAIVALDQLWVDANFKEVQLTHMRLGQPAELVADLYGKKVTYHGTVAGLGMGTGAAFAVLPAQNATGNWIKVVQRVPVRIALDPKELAANPLRVGLSMEVSVDVQDESGAALAQQPPGQPRAQTAVYTRQDQEAEVAVRRIISANLTSAP